MKRRVSKLIALALAVTTTAVFAGCGSTASTEVKDEAPATEATAETEEVAADTASEPIEISYATFMVGTHASAAAETEVIEAFNKQYEGKIKVVVEELPTDDAFVEKMEVLASSKSLPDVLIGKNGIRELAIANGQAVDLKPYLDEDAEWMKYVGEGAMNYNMTDDGKVYSISNQRQNVGYFYNKEMFEAAGIEPAKTWDEFMTNCQTLKDAGFTPLALMTGENAWTTNLWLAAMVGTANDDGNKFMNTSYPDTYNTPEFIDALGKIQVMLKDYTTADAIGAIYSNAANNFEQGQVAMIANGPWMCPDFSDETKSVAGFADKVGVALYPNDGLISQFEVGYILCTADKSEAEQQAALEFLKFKTGAYAQGVFLEKAGVLPLTDNVEITDEYKAANPLIAKTIELAGQAKYTFGTLDNNAYPAVIEEFAKWYPSLAYDEITAEDLASYLSAANDASK
ncbi:MAG: extracellular solute-binding protein [Acetatifactor sp.]|nr:extracellular solute-binding protein [Acetatifactor sp.]